MSLYKQPGSDCWFVDLSVGGKRIRRSSGATSKQAAQEYHDRLKADIWRQSKLGDAPSRTWDEAVTRYVKEQADKKTIEHEKAMLRWSSAYLRGKPLTEITTDTIEDLIEKRRVGRAVTTKDGVSNATINRHMEAVQRVMNKSVVWGWLQVAPKIRHLKEPKGRLRWLTNEEISRLLAALAPHLRAMAKFTLATGLRENNVIELEWSHIDMDRAVCWTLADRTKNGKPLSVPLNKTALEVLKEQSGKHPRYVFVYGGKTITKASTGGWYKALKRANIEDFTWHGLRHTWASHHVMNGTPLEVLKELGGWSSLQMVMRYSHLSPGHVAQYSSNAPDLS